MVEYTPRAIPEDVEGIREFLRDELEEIRQAFASPFIQVTKTHVAPNKAREGMIVLADGVNWNPGSGPGFYGYRNGAWQFLG